MSNDNPEPRNRNHEKDIRFVTKFSRCILGFIGIWPASFDGVGRFPQKFAFVIGNIVLYFAIIPCALHIVYEETDLLVRLKLFGLLSFCVTAVIKYCALAMRRTGIKRCIDHVENDWKLVELYEDREVMLKYGRVGRNLSLICVTFMYSGGIIYHTVLPFCAGKFVDEYNRTVKPLVYPTYSALYDAQKRPVYEIVYFLHCMCGMVMYGITSGACGLAALFATHACGQIEIVISRLEDLVDGKLAKENSISQTRLAAIIECHLRVLRFSATLERILREVCFVEFVGSTFMICLLEYYCITDWEQNNAIGLTTYILLLVSLSFNIFILCYIGELLMEKSSNVGLTCFMIDWYKLPTKTARGLILIIAMSNNPIKLSAGKMADLSLFTFANILKTSVAYLSFLQTTVM